MKAAQDAEFDKLIVAGEPLSKKEQKKLKNNEKPQGKTTNIPVTDLPVNDYRPVGEIPAEE